MRKYLSQWRPKSREKGSKQGKPRKLKGDLLHLSEMVEGLADRLTTLQSTVDNHADTLKDLPDLNFLG